MKKADNFVLDANLLISAFLQSSNSIAARAYYKAKSKGRLVCSEETFDEFSEVFVRTKFDRYLSLGKRVAVIENLRSLMSIVQITTSIKACRDPKDDKYLELAMDSNAVCIITGDKDLLVLHPFNNIPILTAADFLNGF